MKARTWNVLFAVSLLAACIGMIFVAGCSDDDDSNSQGYVYVDGTNGSAGAAGTAEDPLDDIQDGIDLAAAEAKFVRVAEGAYEVNSGVGTEIEMDPAVSIYGGYRNTDGQWDRDPLAFVTAISDLATTGGDYDIPRTAIECGYGLQEGDAPVIDGFLIESGEGDYATGVFITEGSSVTISDCVFDIGSAQHGCGIKNYSSDRDSGTLITVENCLLGGGGGGQTTAINVYRGDLTVRDSVIADLTATGYGCGIDCGYGDIVIADCEIDAGDAASATCALYLNEAFTSAVTGCTISGGTGNEGTYGIRAMDTEGPSSITGNTIDGGTGYGSTCLELGWVEVNPSVDGNVFSAAGGTDRFGVIERDNISDPVSLTGNVFDGSLLSGTGVGGFYRDCTGNILTDFIVIEDVNSLDENGYNPTGTVSGNTTTP